MRIQNGSASATHRHHGGHAAPAQQAPSQDPQWVAARQSDAFDAGPSTKGHGRMLSNGRGLHGTGDGGSIGAGIHNSHIR